MQRVEWATEFPRLREFEQWTGPVVRLREIQIKRELANNFVKATSLEEFKQVGSGRPNLRGDKSHWQVQKVGKSCGI